MFRSIFRTIVITLGFAALTVFPVAAQSVGMTEAEISEAFAKQKTRGLTIAPTTATDPAVRGAPAAATQVTYAEIPEDEQVNIAIGFDFDSAALRDDQKPKLVALCNVMKEADIPVFRIVGHTDSSGSAQYNEKLSLLRAEEVKRHLASDCGIAEDRMQAVGVGAQFPFDAANPRGDVNRRVEFQALS